MSSGFEPYNNSVLDLLFMLQSLARYAEEKRLAVDVSKSHAVVFIIRKKGADSPAFVLDYQSLEMVREFKYLGVGDEKACMSRAARTCCPPFHGWHEACEPEGDKHCDRDRLTDRMLCCRGLSCSTAHGCTVLHAACIPFWRD